MGVPLHDVDGRVLGHLAVMDTAPMTEEPRHLALFHLFARRAAGELERLRSEAAARGSVEDETRALESMAAELRRDQAYGDGELVGRSVALQAVLREVAQVAPTDATVLVLGETGTGKELIARAVHDRSPRRQKPFVTVNCAAIAPALIESELFGHEQGAFTGATRRRDGRFALADGGTIFLDEIGELPLELQPKLLRVLQEGELERVGSAVRRTVDVRVVAATNRDLEAAVARGEFRADLFHRLYVFLLRLPPLRERDDDVVLLANVFAATLAKRLGRGVRPLDAEDARRLRVHPSWTSRGMDGMGRVSTLLLALVVFAPSGAHGWIATYNRGRPVVQNRLVDVDLEGNPDALALAQGRLSVVEYDVTSGKRSWSAVLEEHARPETLVVDAAGDVLAAAGYPIEPVLSEADHLLVAKMDGEQGTILWRRDFTPREGDPRLAPKANPLVVDSAGAVFVGWQGPFGTTSAVKLDPSTGGTLWGRGWFDFVEPWVAVDSVNDFVIAGARPASDVVRVVKLDGGTGATLWDVDLGAPIPDFADVRAVTAPNGDVFVATNTIVLKLASGSGTELWRNDDPTGIWVSRLTPGTQRRPRAVLRPPDAPGRCDGSRRVGANGGERSVRRASERRRAGGSRRRADLPGRRHRRRSLGAADLRRRGSGHRGRFRGCGRCRHLHGAAQRVRELDGVRDCGAARRREAPPQGLRGEPRHAGISAEHQRPALRPAASDRRSPGSDRRRGGGHDREPGDARDRRDRASGGRLDGQGLGGQAG